MSLYERASDIKHVQDQASVCTAADGRAETERMRSRPAVGVIVTTSTATAGKVLQGRRIRPGADSCSWIRSAGYANQESWAGDRASSRAQPHLEASR